MSVRQAAAVLFLVGLVALLLPGCGGGSTGLAVVKGKISYKGKPVPHGTVNFLPNDGNKPTGTGEIQPDGSYELKTFVSNKPSNGAVVGQHKVVIVAIMDQANVLPEQRSPLSEPIVPVKYTSPATSDLSANVENKENTIDFDLQDGK
ncbi:MAG TPA: hypothetical protein VGI40_06420 [Pirellulaceae bacterium]|jgi:hypothetical protein